LWELVVNKEAAKGTGRLTSGSDRDKDREIYELPVSGMFVDEEEDELIERSGGDTVVGHGDRKNRSSEPGIVYHKVNIYK